MKRRFAVLLATLLALTTLALGQNQTQSKSVTINVVSQLSITTTGCPAGVAGQVYAGCTLTASGGVTPYAWTVTVGTLPQGLVLNSTTGAITGTIAAAACTTGTCPIAFTVQVIDSTGTVASISVDGQTVANAQFNGKKVIMGTFQIPQDQYNALP